MEDQRKDCKYISQKCPNYSPDAYTCNHGGGDYCGKFRWYENRTTIRKILAAIKRTINFYFVPFYCITSMITLIYALSVGTGGALLKMFAVVLFGYMLVCFISDVQRWIK